MFPPIIITIPLFPLLRSLRLIDSHTVLIVLYTAFMVSLITLIMRSFIDEVPPEIEEAALIDGCGRFSILVKIILPMTAPSLAASAVIIAVFTWNEFLFALIFTASKARTSPLMISEMLGSFLGVDWGVLFAATSLQLAPILFFTLKIQKHLVRGLTIGAVKG
jgi:multiple sugar transport system permease protein